MTLQSESLLLNRSPFSISWVKFLTGFLQSGPTTEKPTLDIVSSILRKVKFSKQVNILKCIPEARVDDVQSHLRVLTKTIHEYIETYMLATMLFGFPI